MSIWMARLSGDNSVLEMMSQQLNQDNLRIIREDESYFLISSTFDAFDEAQQVHEGAEQLLRLLRGILRRELNHVSKIQIGALCSVHEDGRRDCFVLLHSNSQLQLIGKATATVRNSAGEIVVPSQPSLTENERLINLALQDKGVADALGSAGDGVSRAVNLYKVYESIRDDNGGETHGKANIVRKGWATKDDIERFSVGVNDAVNLGDMARHAPYRKHPSTKYKVNNPMDLQEAERFIRDLMNKWLEERLA